MREDDLGDEIGIVLAFLNELGEVRGNDAEGQRAVDQFLSVVFNKKWRRPWRGGAQDRRTEDFMGALVVVSQRLLLALSRKRGAVDRATEYRESRAVLSGLFPVLSSGGSPRTRRRRPSRGDPSRHLGEIVEREAEVAGGLAQSPATVPLASTIRKT